MTTRDFARTWSSFSTGSTPGQPRETGDYRLERGPCPANRSTPARERLMTRVSRMNARCAGFGLLVILMLLPSRLVAQGGVSGSIAGVGKDTSGAVIPGVSVEAASPALIEKTREAVTDAQGLYKIIDLRPGTYAVTFT